MLGKGSAKTSCVDSYFNGLYFISLLFKGIKQKSQIPIFLYSKLRMEPEKKYTNATTDPL
jgi:hypothetical protein